MRQRHRELHLLHKSNLHFGQTPTHTRHFVLFNLNKSIYTTGSTNCMRSRNQNNELWLRRTRLRLSLFVIAILCKNTIELASSWFYQKHSNLWKALDIREVDVPIESWYWSNLNVFVRIKMIQIRLCFYTRLHLQMVRVAR